MTLDFAIDRRAEAEFRERVRASNRAAQAGAPPRASAPALNTPPPRAFTPYGQARVVWNSTASRLIFSGPADTGKTMVLLHKLDALCQQYKRLKCAIVRKVRADMPSTVLKTWEDKVIGIEPGEDTAPGGIRKFGGESPSLYRYPNKSIVYVAGLDRPGKVLSGELDIVVVNQAEELEEGDWGTLTTRTNGRAGGLVPGLLLGDANPGASTHWIKRYEAEERLTFIQSSHRDNPEIYDQETGEITPVGKIRLEPLDKLPGVMRDRFFLGLWKSAEGTVYEPFNVLREPFSPIRRYVGGVDWGWTNPGCLQIWGEDGDGRIYRAAEQYRSGIHVSPVEGVEPDFDCWVRRAKDLQQHFGVEIWLCDPSEPQYIAAFQSAGLNAVAADNARHPGFQRVQGRQRADAIGYPRINLLVGSRGYRDPLGIRDDKLAEKNKPTCLEEEQELYVWPKDTSGKPMKEDPVDDNNHACDAMRYAVNHLDGGGGFFYA